MRKSVPLLHFRHYATYRKLRKKIQKKSEFFFQFLVFWQLLLSPVVEKVVFESFWALDMAPTWAVPGLFTLSQLIIIYFVLFFRVKVTSLWKTKGIQETIVVSRASFFFSKLNPKIGSLQCWLSNVGFVYFQITTMIFHIEIILLPWFLVGAFLKSRLYSWYFVSVFFRYTWSGQNSSTKSSTRF